MPGGLSAPNARSGAPAKRPTNLSLSTDVLDAAKAMNINISQVCDAYLREVVRREQERRWSFCSRATDPVETIASVQV